MYVLVLNSFTRLARIMLAITAKEYQPVDDKLFASIPEARQYAIDHNIQLAQ